MINSIQLYYALQCMRGDIQTYLFTRFDKAKDTTISDMVLAPTKAIGLDTKNLPYSRLILPEFIASYATNISPKSYMDDITSWPNADDSADIVKSETGLQYIYNGDEKWVSQKDVFNCYFKRNNLLRYTSTINTWFYSYMGVLTHEQTYTSIFTTWDRETDTYKITTTVDVTEGIGARRSSRSKGYFYDYNQDPQVAYCEQEGIIDIKLKLVLNSNFINSTEFIKLTFKYYDSLNLKSKIYDAETVELKNNQVVTVPGIPDFDPLSYSDPETWASCKATFQRSNIPQRKVIEYKKFNTYQDVIDLVMQ